jgi:creatinine amidohydrolase/Fe(II)-dependent formamide hydrolase-like protein
LHPGHVSEIKEQHEPEFVPQAFLDYFDSSEITENGYWGYPESASAEKGKRAIERLVDSAVEYMQTLENVTKRVKAKRKANLR